MLFLIPVAAAHVLPYRAGFAYTRLTYFQPTLNDSLITPWANFDGIHYLEIAGRGYQTEARFFPLYPLLVRLTGLGLFPTYSFGSVIAGLLVSNAFFLAGLFLFFRLLRLDFNGQTTWQTLLALVLFPTAFFFVSVYAESLFFFLSVASFFLARQKKWWLAALCAALLCVTRVVGMAIVPALLAELVIQKAPKRAFLSLLFTPIGLLGWLIFNQQKWGNALSFVRSQGELGNGRSTTTPIDPLQTLFRYAHIFTTVSTHQYEFWVAVLELAGLCLAVVLLIMAWRQRVRVSYLIFGLLCILMPLLSGTLSGLPRYMLVAFPICIALGNVRNEKAKIVMLITAAIGTCVLLSLVARGYYVA